MSDEIKRIPWAFPTVIPQDGSADFEPGMTLRDWFAGQALAGDMATYTNDEYCLPEPAQIAAYAYEIADAMLKAREAGDE